MPNIWVSHIENRVRSRTLLANHWLPGRMFIVCEIALPLAAKVKHNSHSGSRPPCACAGGMTGADHLIGLLRRPEISFISHVSWDEILREHATMMRYSRMATNK